MPGGLLNRMGRRASFFIAARLGHTEVLPGSGADKNLLIREKTPELQKKENRPNREKTLDTACLTALE